MYPIDNFELPVLLYVQLYEVFYYARIYIVSPFNAIMYTLYFFMCCIF